MTVMVFAVVYLWLIVRKRYRATALWVGVALLLVLPRVLGLTSVLDLRDLVRIGPEGTWASINWNVMGIFAGTLLVAEVFIYSRVPTLCADVLINKSPNVGWAILSVCILSAVISTFAENVATVLIIAPIALALARRLQVSPTPFLIGIAISANLQGTATLIGDPPSMILASRYRLNFDDFFYFNGRPGIFFAVQVGAVAGFAVLWLIFRRYKAPVVELEPERPRSWFPTIVMAAMVLALATASHVDENFLWFGGACCMVAGFGCVFWLFRRDRDSAVKVLKSYDWSTTFFLMGVFVMVYALSNAGLMEMAAKGLYSVTGSNVLAAFLLIVVFSVLLSAFVDNIPYIAAMLPVVDMLGANMDLMEANMLLPFGLLVGSCLGGNITPIGASANVVAYGMLHKRGEDTSFFDFVRIGLPFTVAATGAAALSLWIIWMWL